MEEKYEKLLDEKSAEIAQLRIQNTIKQIALEEIAGSPPNGERAIRLAKKALGLKVYA